MKPPAIVVMGVTGCGKTTVGEALARRLGWDFHDADDYHPPENVEKMRAGIALDDDDRRPWLDRLNSLMRHSVAKNRPLVLACSALKAAYRDRLASRLPALAFVHLSGSFELIDSRLRARQHRYMPAGLLQSQFDTLEPLVEGLALDVARPADELVGAIVDALAREFGAATTADARIGADQSKE